MRRTHIKVCGVTSEHTIEAAVEAGVDALGFVFAESPRQMRAERAAALARMIPLTVLKVAVFFHASEDEVRRVLCEFSADVVQSEPPLALESARLLPVFHDDEAVCERVEESTAPGDVVMLESAGRGGRGAMPDWSHAERLALTRRLVLAGGLNPDNVGDAIAMVRPFAVDVSSGVESSPGVKDARLIRALAQAVRNADMMRDEATHKEHVP